VIVVIILEFPQAILDNRIIDFLESLAVSVDGIDVQLNQIRQGLDKIVVSHFCISSKLKLVKHSVYAVYGYYL
jgi:hypothetical protein